VKDDWFKDFVLDQLSGLPELRAKAMFGGHGLYANEKFFGILMDGRLYFKTDEHTRPLYEQRGMVPFTYEKARKTMTMRYFEVPAEILESKSQLLEWARSAVGATNSANAGKCGGRKAELNLPGYRKIPVRDGTGISEPEN